MEERVGKRTISGLRWLSLSDDEALFSFSIGEPVCDVDKGAVGQGLPRNWFSFWSCGVAL
jgi:hypothetical protein